MFGLAGGAGEPVRAGVWRALAVAPVVPGVVFVADGLALVVVVAVRLAVDVGVAWGVAVALGVAVTEGDGVVSASSTAQPANNTTSVATQRAGAGFTGANLQPPCHPRRPAVATGELVSISHDGTSSGPPSAPRRRPASG
jgi:hypothetical protein